MYLLYVDVVSVLYFSFLTGTADGARFHLTDLRCDRHTALVVLLLSPKYSVQCKAMLHIIGMECNYVLSMCLGSSVTSPGRHTWLTMGRMVADLKGAPGWKTIMTGPNPSTLH